jgi:hypothetical protein
MPNPRRDVRKQHERCVVLDFLQWFEAHRRLAFSVVAEPDPPEAIIQSGNVFRWVEVVDAFWSTGWARDQYSYATPGERHTPIGPGPYVAPDATFCASFVAVLANKLKKKSYSSYVAKYGPGFLIVNIDYPLFSSTTLDAITQSCLANPPEQDAGCFAEVFLRIREFSGYRIQPFALRAK